MITAKALSKTFKDKKRGEIRAVDSVSFSCIPGRIYGLLGGNGAGKTTTLRMLATLLKPTQGTASVAGFDVIQDAEKVRARLGFLAASTALYGRLTARETIRYFGTLNGMSEQAIAARTAELITQLDLSEFIDRRVESYSTGMKQRVSIARTVVHDPEVLILDEPTLGLDVMASRNIITFVRDCRARGKTIIYSTHVMSEATKLCDTIGILHRGRIVAEGSLAELQARYALEDLEDIFVSALGGEGENTL